MSSKQKILIVDDDRDFVEAQRQILEGNGYEVAAAYSGEKGLETAKASLPGLIILDVMMAHQTEGFDISRRIPKTRELKDTPVIMITGIRSAMKLGYGFNPDDTWLPVKSVLEKPVSDVRLLAEIRKYLQPQTATANA